MMSGLYCGRTLHKFVNTIYIIANKTNDPMLKRFSLFALTR